MKQRNWYRVVLAFTSVLAVGASLWFAAPVSALTIDITTPSPTTLGSSISFDVTVNIEDTELIPIQSVDLKIYNSTESSTYYDKYTGLPLATTADYVPYATEGTGGVANIKATAESSWGYAYGYRYADWEGTAYYFDYGYGYGPGPTSITYNVTWESPAGWPAGDYKIETKITADSTEFIKTKSITLTRRAGGGGGGGGRDVTPPRLSDISTTTVGKTNADIYWRTQELSNSQVEYGESLSMLSKLDEEMVLNHHVQLTDLTPGTSYQYKVMSRDKSGNLAVSDEYTFTTLGVPPTFTTTALAIFPAEVDIGGSVTISVSVRNSGDAPGSYEVTLKIDDVLVATKAVDVAAGASQEVIFITSQNVAKTYAVSVNGLTGSFVVKPAPPAPAPAPAPVPPPPPPVVPPPAMPVNWWLLGGIIAATMAVTVAISLSLLRRRVS